MTGGSVMNKTLKKVFLFTSSLILLLFILFVINQTAQVVQLAEKVTPSLGNLVFWGLLIIYAVFILVPVFLFLSLPKSLTPPKSEDAPEFHSYLAALKK